MAKEVNKKDNKKEEKVAKTNSNSMRSELKKVTWPTRKELVNSTVAVIVIVIITAIIVFFLDVVFESFSTYGINRLRTVVSDKVNKDDNTTENAVEEVVDNEEDANENTTTDDNTVTSETTNTTTEGGDTTNETPVEE